MCCFNRMLIPNHTNQLLTIMILIFYLLSFFSSTIKRRNDYYDCYGCFYLFVALSPVCSTSYAFYSLRLVGGSSIITCTFPKRKKVIFSFMNERNFVNWISISISVHTFTVFFFNFLVLRVFLFESIARLENQSYLNFIGVLFTKKSI